MGWRKGGATSTPTREEGKGEGERGSEGRGGNDGREGGGGGADHTATRQVDGGERLLRPRQRDCAFHLSRGHDKICTSEIPRRNSLDPPPRSTTRPRRRRLPLPRLPRFPLWGVVLCRWQVRRLQEPGHNKGNGRQRENRVGEEGRQPRAVGTRDTNYGASLSGAPTGRLARSLVAQRHWPVICMHDTRRMAVPRPRCAARTAKSCLPGSGGAPPMGVQGTRRTGLPAACPFSPPSR